MPGGVAHAPQTMFLQVKDKLIGVGCPAYILSNYLQHGMNILD
jgi:hypothetical protein